MNTFVVDLVKDPWLPGSVARSITFALVVLCQVGCGPQDDAPKESHFEHDHEVAVHWPSDLADAAIKIRERLVWIDTGEMPEEDPHDNDHDDHERDPKSEIIDLVSWIPEVAADTNLSEADWSPLYHASESLMANLRASKTEYDGDDRAQIESLCKLIDETVPKIPEQLASLKGASL
ncbi:MAG: hypothetical protein WBD20_04465 [Pirellulaceae bacterium]